MHLVYIDDSKGDRLACFSAIAIPDDSWHSALAHITEARQQLKSCYGLFVRKELHAVDFVSGHGRYSDRFLPKAARADIFKFILSCVALLPGARLFNAAVPIAEEERGFNWLLNRVNTNMERSGSHAVVISDEGKNYDAMLRRMRRVNYIPSRYGHWPGHGASKNFPVTRILEDIVYRDSTRSYFVQLADFCGWALLRRERPTLAAQHYGLHDAFYITEPIMVKQANRRDPYGVIR
jgi:hypothetical protein